MLRILRVTLLKNIYIYKLYYIFRNICFLLCIYTALAKGILGTYFLYLSELLLSVLFLIGY